MMQGDWKCALLSATGSLTVVGMAVTHAAAVACALSRSASRAAGSGLREWSCDGAPPTNVWAGDRQAIREPLELGEAGRQTYHRVGRLGH